MTTIIWFRDSTTEILAPTAQLTPVGRTRSITGPVTVAASAFDILECDCTAGAVTVTMPANVAGTLITVKKMDASANPVTVTATVDGTVNPTLIYRYGSMELVADGTIWLRTVRPALGALVDYPATLDARYPLKTDPWNMGGIVLTTLWNATVAAAAWSTANKGMWMRVLTGGTISKVLVNVTTQNGNICVAAYAGTGVGPARVPVGPPLATSGSIACPAPGDQPVALGSSIAVAPGDFLYLGSDSGTAAFLGFGSGTASTLYAGLIWRAVSSFPAPSTVPTLVADAFHAPVLVGVA